MEFILAGNIPKQRSCKRADPGENANFQRVPHGTPYVRATERP